MEDDSNVVIHVQQDEDSPWVPKLLFMGGMLYVFAVVLAIATSGN